MFADWMRSVIAPVLWLKTIPNVLDRNSTYTGFALSHTHACTHHMSVHGQEYAMYITATRSREKRHNSVMAVDVFALQHGMAKTVTVLSC